MNKKAYFTFLNKGNVPLNKLCRVEKCCNIVKSFGRDLLAARRGNDLLAARRGSDLLDARRVKSLFTAGDTGAEVPHRKNTKKIETIYMPSPKSVTISMLQHIGAPCDPIVSKGDHVYMGQTIAESNNFLSSRIHSSISGEVQKIDKIRMPSGELVDAITIESDGKNELYNEIKPPYVNDKQSLIKAIRESGLVGLGGAGFPAHVKLNIPNGKSVDTIIINAAECEPYITADHRECIENSWELFSGIYAIKEILNIDRVIIGVENNKPDVIKILKKIADNHERDPKDKVKVLTLKSRYPNGAEKVIIKACTGIEVPKGKLPIDVGCIVMNVSSVTFLSKYLKTGIPLISKRITVDGSAIKDPKNVIVPIGTKICDIIEFCGGYKETPKKILMGGPMMGISLPDDTLPILKQNNAILAFSEKDAKLPEPSSCIRCAKCVESCPMGLIPTKLERYSVLQDKEELTKLNIMNCMECGTCVFNCPASRQILQSIKMGKQLIKK